MVGAFFLSLLFKYAHENTYASVYWNNRYV